MYTLEMAEAVRRVTPPRPVTLDIRENEWGLTIIVYPDEIGNIDIVEQMKVMQYLEDVARLLQSYGLKVRVKGVSGVPQRLR